MNELSSRSSTDRLCWSSSVRVGQQCGFNATSELRHNCGELTHRNSKIQIPHPSSGAPEMFAKKEKETIIAFSQISQLSSQLNDFKTEPGGLKKGEQKI